VIVVKRRLAHGIALRQFEFDSAERSKTSAYNFN
jgi:hypothetical protein